MQRPSRTHCYAMLIFVYDIGSVVISKVIFLWVENLHPTLMLKDLSHSIIIPLFLIRHLQANIANIIVTSLNSKLFEHDV